LKLDVGAALLTLLGIECVALGHHRHSTKTVLADASVTARLGGRLILELWVQRERGDWVLRSRVCRLGQFCRDDLSTAVSFGVSVVTLPGVGVLSGGLVDKDAIFPDLEAWVFARGCQRRHELIDDAGCREDATEPRPHRTEDFLHFLFCGLGN